MKSFTLAAVLLATTAVTPLLAADIPAVSKVDAVTVFPSGAEVTRVAEAKISAGEHSLIFEGLPGDLMPETCLLYTSPSPRDRTRSRMPSSA